MSFLRHCIVSVVGGDVLFGLALFFCESFVVCLVLVL